MRARKSFRRDGPLDAWLWRAVVNAALDRRRRRSPLRLADDELDQLASRNGDQAHGREVTDALARLPERQRLVLFLRYYADLDYRTIGETLQITTGAVGATLHATQAALRSTLEEVPQ